MSRKSNNYGPKMNILDMALMEKKNQKQVNSPPPGDT